MKRESLFNTEAELCAAFIEFAKGQGWTCYPETEGWDILLVDADGFQLGIQAKMTLNLKVIDQALPQSFSMDTGPDHRGLLVPTMNYDARSLLHAIGLEVFHANNSSSRPQWAFMHHERRMESVGRRSWFDWNPTKRCQLPEYMPDVRAGVPSPVQLTPWKIGALKILAHLQLHESITREQIALYHNDPRRWCGGDGWLVPVSGSPRKGGSWAMGKPPRFDQQHPVVYAQILAELRLAAPAGQQELVA